MSRIVLDTNCLILCLPEKSRYHEIWLSFGKGINQLCLSNSILEEYFEIISRFWGKDIAQDVTNIILNGHFTIFVDPTFNYNLINADPDDNKFVNCALMGNARCIVTEDKHFEVLRNIDFPKIDVIGIDDFLKTLKR
jgi:putative PIN family toxin of toxin-antitoxin system